MRRLAVPVDHVHEPDVLGQRGVERQLAAAKDQFRSELGRGITGLDPGHELCAAAATSARSVSMAAEGFCGSSVRRGGVVADQRLRPRVVGRDMRFDPVQTQ